MKRLIAVAGAAAMLLSAASPVLAFMPMGGSTTTNFAIVDNTAVAKSSTGDNMQFGSSNWLVTGMALSSSEAVTIANTNVKSCWNCWGSGNVFNSAVVDNTSIAKSETGDNWQTGFGCWGNHAITGNAGSDASAWTLVNTNWSY